MKSDTPLWASCLLVLSVIVLVFLGCAILLGLFVRAVLTFAGIQS